MRNFDRLKAIIALKPKKILLVKPESDKRVYVYFTDTYLIVVSKSSYKDVGLATYFHDLVTGEFIHANGRNNDYKNTDRLLIAEYNTLCELYK